MVAFFLQLWKSTSRGKCVWMKKRIAAMLGLVFTLSACSAETQPLETESPAQVDQSVESPAPDSNPEPEYATAYEEGCAMLDAGTLTHKYLELYRPLVEDICKDFEMRYDLVDVVLSPEVNREDAEFYVDANVFGLSYWDRYAPNGIDHRRILLLMEEEQDWWSEQLGELLKTEPTWFGPSAEGGHCTAAVADAFCTKLYVANEGDTKVDFDVFTTMLGSRIQWTTFRKVVPIHEATHAFHTAIELSNWEWWVMEGQATYFELAASVLVPELGAGNWRDDQMQQAFGQDKIQFTAKTAEEVEEHIKACDRPDVCNGLRYIGASMAHELLVNTYGMDAYFAWNKDMAERLPPMNYRNFDNQKAEIGNRLFPEIFEDNFGIPLETWEKEQLYPYLIENYRL
jgi:hypothetical protein